MTSISCLKDQIYRAVDDAVRGLATSADLPDPKGVAQYQRILERLSWAYGDLLDIERSDFDFIDSYSEGEPA